MGAARLPSSVRWARRAVFVVMLMLCAGALWAWYAGRLGVLPEEVVMHAAGRGGLLLLLVVLGCGFATRLTGWRGFVAVRRQLGLWAFAVLGGHVALWAWFDQGGDPAIMAAEIAHIAYLQVGVAAFLMLVPLVITSIPRVQRAMRRSSWRRLHLGAHAAAGAGLLHYFLLAPIVAPGFWLALGAWSAFVVARVLGARGA